MMANAPRFFNADKEAEQNVTCCFSMDGFVDCSIQYLNDPINDR